MTSWDLPTLSETLQLQTDIDALCQDRPLTTTEIFPPNAFYGNDLVLKRYAGLADDAPLYCVVPHGPFLDPAFVWGAEARSNLPVVLCYPEYRASAYRAAMPGIVVPAAAPYVYCRRILDDFEVPSRRGTIFFAPHSTHHVVVNEKNHDLARSLAEVDERFRPVRVCVYWRDVLLGRHLPFIKAGLSVVSAGHMYDPYFLFRLHHLCSLHQYSASSTIGSHVFYSVHSGCTHLQLPGFDDPPPTELDGVLSPEKDAVRIAPSGEIEDLPDVRAVFFLEDPSEWSLQNAAANYFLGYANRLAPEDLAKQLRAAKRLDRTGYCASAGGVRFCQLPPMVYRRTARTLLSACKRRWRRIGQQPRD